MSLIRDAAATWDPWRADLITLAHVLHGTCKCGRPIGRPGRRHCCEMCRSGARHGVLCCYRNGERR